MSASSDAESIHVVDKKCSESTVTTNSISDSTSGGNSVVTSTVAEVVSSSLNCTPVNKTLANVSTKASNTQVLILQKPPVSSASLIVPGKNVLPIATSIDSSSNVTVVQPVIGPSGATKFVTIPAMGMLSGANSNSSVPSALSAVKGSDIKILLPQPSSSSGSATVLPIRELVGNSATLEQVTAKRNTASNVNNQVITKVIITNNPASSEDAPAATSIPVSVSGSLPSSTGPQQSLLITSPPKTLTLTRNIVNVSGSQQIIRTVSATPTKQGMYVLSPVKSASKIMGVPLSISKSPRRIAPATSTALSTVVTGSKACVVTSVTTTPVSATSRTVTSIPPSPTKVILKPVQQQTVLKPVGGSSNAVLPVSVDLSSAVGGVSTTTVQQGTTTNSGATTQQVQVPGSKLHYFRLISAPTTSTTATAVTKQTALIPVSNARAQAVTIASTSSSTAVTSAVSSGQVRFTVPIAPALNQNQVAQKPAGQRIIIPTPSLTQSVPTGQLNQLSSGTFIPVGGAPQSFVMVPAQYVTQGPRMVIQPIQQQNVLPPAVSAPNTPTSISNSSYVPLVSSSSNLSHPPAIQPAPSTAPQLPPRHLNGRTPMDTNDNRPRKPCNCTKSQCLKLYCDCFANGEFCNNCNCNNCYNNLAHEEERQKAIKACLDRNPLAFHPKIGKCKDGDIERRHTKGCNCKRSGCLKNYCECYEAKILCTNLCKCIGCKNFEDSSERKTLMHLADAAEVRVQQQAAAKTKLSSQILDLPTKPPTVSTTGEKLPFSFITQEVVEATCLCLLAQVEEGERSGHSPSVIEKLVLDEFGRCLMHIIDCANRTKVPKGET